MPILPLDLQTMFSHMNQVGKEQAAQKEVAPQHQALQGQEIAQKTKDLDTAVNETRDIGEGLEKVKDEERENRGEGREPQKKEAKKKEDENKKEPVVYQDPNLGHHIDIIG